jgi:hypothetical protein
MSDQSNLTEVRGRALYLEFRNHAMKYTFQLLAHPDGIAQNGGYVSFGVFYRTLNQSYPKRPWTTSRVSLSEVKSRPVNEHTGRMVLPDTVLGVTSASSAFTGHLDPIFDQLTRQGYSLYKQPLIVEVSNHDLTEIGDDSTPYALFRRVMSARKATGFPDSLLVENA